MLMQYQYDHTRQEGVRRKWWVKPWAREERREAQGLGANLIPEMRETDPESFKNFFRMEPMYYDELLELVKPHITKQDTTMRNAIKAEDKLAVTLRFLAGGSSYKELMYSFRISKSSISKFVPEVCDTIYDILKNRYCKLPDSNEKWLEVAKNFHEQWQFPHCLGAIDGKHINIRCPPSTGSQFFNYKKQFSVVLLGIADANAKFIAFDLGSQGSQSDGGILKNSPLSSICDSPDIPRPSAIGSQPGLPIPYYLIGDEAFALSAHMMKPYPHRSAIGDEKVFNYRLSRARRIIENAFGVMSARFRILLRTMELNPQNAISVTRACIILHNFLLSINDQRYCPRGFMDSELEDGTIVPGAWRNHIEGEVCDVQASHAARPSTAVAREIRDGLKEYFFTEGAVGFQWRMTQ